ncbi:hypothetical protein [Fodinicola feengrottensis]|uniref:hypothetical protein n=1 Tax=Fodinicola feengrottensis TaxID=435914 RepID=UPI0013D84B49|nr:hypothetical protein [Fodinicola feengrottensis]
MTGNDGNRANTTAMGEANVVARRAITGAAAVIAVVLLAGGAFVAGHSLGRHQRKPPANPSAPMTKPAATIALPAIGPCAAGNWNFLDGVAKRSSSQLALAAAPRMVGDPDPTYADHDFNEDGQSESIREITCQVVGGTDRVAAILALTSTGFHSAGVLGDKPITTHTASASAREYFSAYGIVAPTGHFEVMVRRE